MIIRCQCGDFIPRDINSLVTQYRGYGDTKFLWHQSQIENSYRASRLARGSVAQVASAMATFLLHLNVDREARTWQPSQSRARGTIRLATLNASPWQTMSFTHGSIVLTNQMSQDTNGHFLKFIYSNIIIMVILDNNEALWSMTRWPLAPYASKAVLCISSYTRTWPIK